MRREQAARTHDPQSWAFWRKRIGRALILAALLLFATQVIPQLPQDQRILFVAPKGERLGTVVFSYSERGHSLPLGKVHLELPGPVEQLPHTLRLRDGAYRIELEADGTGSKGPVHWSGAHAVTLSGGTTRVYLKASQD